MNAPDIISVVADSIICNDPDYPRFVADRMKAQGATWLRAYKADDTMAWIFEGWYVRPDEEPPPLSFYEAMTIDADGNVPLSRRGFGV